MAGVDVLAVIDAEVQTLRRLESWVNEALAPTRADAQGAILAMTQARAAVAELIEAASPCVFAIDHPTMDGHDSERVEQAARNLSAALRNVQGGA